MRKVTMWEASDGIQFNTMEGMCEWEAIKDVFEWLKDHNHFEEGKVVVVSPEVMISALKLYHTAYRAATLGAQHL